MVSTSPKQKKKTYVVCITVSDKKETKKLIIT